MLGNVHCCRSFVNIRCLAPNSNFADQRLKLNLGSSGPYGKHEWDLSVYNIIKEKWHRVRQTPESKANVL